MHTEYRDEPEKCTDALFWSMWSTIPNEKTLSHTKIVRKTCHRHSEGGKAWEKKITTSLELNNEQFSL